MRLDLQCGETRLSGVGYPSNTWKSPKSGLVSLMIDSALPQCPSCRLMALAGLASPESGV